MPDILYVLLTVAGIAAGFFAGWETKAYRVSAQKSREWLSSHTRSKDGIRPLPDHAYIRSYVFPDGMLERAAARCPRKTSVEDLEEGLRQYLFAAGVALVRGSGAGMPSQTVDEAWHEFMIYTRSYAEFCDRAYGRFMHHEPEVTMTTAGVTENQTAAMARTWTGACAYADLDPNHATKGPILFELDAKVGVKDAKQYIANCGSTTSCEAGKKVCVKHALRQVPFEVKAPATAARTSTAASSRSTSARSSSSRSSSSSSSSSGMDPVVIALLASDTSSNSSCGSSSSSHSSCGSSSSSSCGSSSSSSCGSSSSSSCGSSCGSS